MYIRVKKFGKNKQRKYYYIVKSIKVKGKAKQEVIRYLGTIQNIVDIVDKSNKK